MKEIEILEKMRACEPAIEWLKTQKSHKRTWHKLAYSNNVSSISTK